MTSPHQESGLSSARFNAATKLSSPSISGGAPNRLSVYTRTGDKGTSSLYSGERRSKDDFVFHALGDVDELNSLLGLARMLVAGTPECSDLEQQLEAIQSRLLDLGSAIATPAHASDAKLRRVNFPETNIADLEHWIDSMDEHLPPLSTFILPSGGPAACHMHIARAVCRRAERSLVPLTANSDLADGNILIYLNRLSDYLFTAARLMAKRCGEKEVTYKKAQAE